MGHGKVTVGHIGKPGHGCEYGAVAQWCDLVFVELHPGSNIVERLWRVRKIHAVTLVDIGIVDADKIVIVVIGDDSFFAGIGKLMLNYQSFG